MLLATAIVPKTDLCRLIDSITPLRVTVDEQRGRVISLSRPTVELVPGRGLRLRGTARVVWDFALVPIPVTVNKWQLLFVPRVESTDSVHVLRFEPELEELEVKLVPGFVDEKIADSIRGAIAKIRERLAWNFARTLSKRLPLPAKISPRSTFEIFPIGGDVSVDDRELQLMLRFEARFERERRFDETTTTETMGTSLPERVREGQVAPSPSPRGVDPMRRPLRRPPLTKTLPVAAPSRRPPPLRRGR
jgi:hypothetical protein